MKCTNCGFENEANARSCQSCGAKLPKQIVVIDEIIRTFNGKIDRKQMITKYQ